MISYLGCEPGPEEDCKLLLGERAEDRRGWRGMGWRQMVTRHGLATHGGAAWVGDTWWRGMGWRHMVARYRKMPAGRV